LEQLNWLRDMLIGAKDQLIFVFSHHRPRELESDVQKLLAEFSRGRLVFLSGHSHQHQLDHIVDGRPGHDYFELNTGALNTFPQVGRIVELKRLSNGPTCYCLYSRWTWPSFIAPSLAELMPPPGLKETMAQRLFECDDDRMMIRHDF